MKNYTELHEFLLAVIDNVPYGVIAIDMEGNISMINEKALQNLNIQRETQEVLGSNIVKYLSEISDLAERFQESFDNGREEFDLQDVLFGGRYLNVHAKPIITGMLLSVSDITEKKQAQEGAMLALLKGQEMERRRLAKEIHDGIGPLMSTIRLHLDAVKNELEDAPSKVTNKIHTMDQLIQNVATDIRDISHDLMPGSLVDFGLVEALKNLCSKVNGSEILEVTFYDSGIKRRLDRNVELNLYRITQELLNNALKYARAKNIQVQLIQRKNNLVLTVEDDGVGFDPDRLDEIIQNGIGLRNIQTRASSLRGNFTIDTQKGKGVFSTIAIPVKN